MRRVRGLRVVLSGFLVLTGLAVNGQAGEEQAKPAPEAEIVIVKYGSLSVKTSEPDVRIYVDDSYKGSADSVVESIVTGEHRITCSTDTRSVSGTFEVRKNETLRLEARFDEGKLIQFRAPVKTVGPGERQKPEPAKAEKPLKPAAEAKKAEPRNLVEERRRARLDVMKFEYEITDDQHIKVEHIGNRQAISKFTLDTDSAGKYYRTKQAVLLCETGPCEMTWTSRFVYTDENGKTDAVLLHWKETVFNGVTPAGTSRQDLECCLNGQCWKMPDTGMTDVSREFDVGRYRLTWNKTSLLIRRLDIVKEILAAGRSLSDY